MSFQLSENDLYTYQAPQERFEKAQRAMGEIPVDEFFSRAGEEYKNIRELWASSLFAWGLSLNGKWCEVRLHKDDPPDFVLRSTKEGREYSFELTEMMEPKRRRGDEYRRAENQSEMKEIDVPYWINRKIEEKAQKNYAILDLNLLVLVNIYLFEKLELESVREICESLKDTFSSIWLLRDGLFGQLFSTSSFEEFSDEWMKIPPRIKYHEDWLNKNI